jgi:glycosyltransferase involved in cell wall biosynthesis
MGSDFSSAVVIPIGPGKETALDTIESVAHYCPEPHELVLIDDCTQDGAFEALTAARKPNWHVLRNPRHMGRLRLVHSLCTAFRWVLQQTRCELVLRLDQDALLIHSGVLSDARDYASNHPAVGLFGVYECDYDRPRSYDVHRRCMTREIRWWRLWLGRAPSWAPLLEAAERQGYKRGDNVFGGAYFVTRACLEGMRDIGALDVPYDWHSRLMEDVYFSMAAVAAGFRLGHFAAPNGPLCLEWEGLPYPAKLLSESHFKLVHSVDKGKNTDREANSGASAREIFRKIRQGELIRP